jgi:CRP-like cAMP-binding protein
MLCRTTDTNAPPRPVNGHPQSTIQLFDADPDLLSFLSPQERAEANQIRVPVRTIPKGPIDIQDVLKSARAFGALVLDGMLLQSIQLGDHIGLRLLGPGDVLSLIEAPASMLVINSDCRATVPTRLMLLEREVLRAARQWPRILAGLHVRNGEQTDRLVTQVMICQLPRVDDRLLSLMWLMAESWGHVTPAGTIVPIALTHEALGGLIGARRPTVTLALGELADRGAILRQDRGWLLLETPTAPHDIPVWITDEPRLLDQEPSRWASGAPQPAVIGTSFAALRETVVRLREEHLRNTDQVRDRLRQFAVSREKVSERRQMMEREALSRRAPSS